MPSSHDDIHSRKELWVFSKVEKDLVYVWYDMSDSEEC